MTTPIPKSESIKPPRPNKDEHQREMLLLTEKINGLREEMSVLHGKMPSKDSNSGLTKERETLKAKFDHVLNQKKALQKTKREMFDQVGVLKTGIRKKSDEMKSSKDKIGYRNVSDIDSNIADIEDQLRKGRLSLMEEKKAVAEISTLKRARTALEGLSSQPSGIEADKAKIDVLKANMDAIEKEIKALDIQVTAAKEAWIEKEKILKESFGSLSFLFDTKKEITLKLNAARDEKNALYQSFKVAQDAWYTWERDEKKKRIEAEKLERAAEKEARIAAQAERELEDADIQAFQNEIAICDALILFFKNQIPKEKDQVVASCNTVDNALMHDAIPARATVLSRKDDRDEDFFVGSKKKNKKRGNANTAKPIKMDIELIDQLSKLSISIPKTTADAPEVIAGLEEKKQYFLDNSAAQTAANKLAALKNIEKLRSGALNETAEE